MGRLPPLPPAEPPGTPTAFSRLALRLHSTPGPFCPPPQRGLSPLGTSWGSEAGGLRPPGRQGWSQPRAGGPCSGAAGAGAASAPAEGWGRRRLVPVRSLPRTSSGATSGAHVRPGDPDPLPGVGARIPGRGLGGPGSSSLFPCSPPGAWPGPDSASARPCAPPHTRAHTHSHSLARSHTRTPLPPPALFISSSCLGTQEKPSTAPAPRSLRSRPAPRSRWLRYGKGARQFPEWPAGAPAPPRARSTSAAGGAY